MPCLPGILNLFLTYPWTHHILFHEPESGHISISLLHCTFFFKPFFTKKTPQRNFGRLLWSLQSELLSLLLTVGREFITLYFQNVFWMNSLIYLFIPCTYTVKSWLKKYHTTKSKGSTLSLRSVTLDGLSTLPGSPNPKYVSLERLFYFNNDNYILFVLTS